MISDYRCFYCFARAFEKILEKDNISDELKKYFTLDMINMCKDSFNDFSAPRFSRELHSLLRKYTNNPDPYKEEKEKNNDQAISLLPGLKKLVSQSDSPFKTALRLAIAGNIIDFAVKDNFNLPLTIEKALADDFAIDHSDMLKIKIEDARNILYIGDNAGEIVFDKLFIETINRHNIIYVVRGAPVINDVTMEDAKYTGMTDLVKVISTEYDAPSTIVNKSGKLFQEYFEKADLIISKGQGNLEGLIPLNDSRIFYLLMAKCNVIAEFLKVNKGSFVVYNPAF